MNMKTSLGTATCLAAALYASAAVAQGQPPEGSPARTAAPAGASGADDGRALADIVVTARRREESAQSVPVSVTAFSGAALEQRNVRSMQDLNLVTPGLRFSAEGGKNTTTVVLRGLGRNPIGEGVAAVVTYFADVAVVGEGTNIPTYDVASVQVLKGPQGTLFGRNTIGGAIVIQPEAPTYEVGGYVRGEVGSFNHRMVEGALNVPIVADKVALRLAGQVRRRDGSIRNLSGGPDFNDLHQDAFRVSLLVEPFEGLSNKFIYDYFKADENAAGLYLYAHNVGVIPGLSAALDPQIAQYRASQISAGYHAVDSVLGEGVNPPGSSDRKLWGIANDTKLEIGNITVRNIFGYRRTTLRSTINTSGLGEVRVGGVPFTVFLADSAQSRQYLTNEFQILGEALDGRLNFIAGAFYNNDKPYEGGGSHFIAFSATGLAPYVTSNVANKNKAVFGQIGYKLTDALTFNLGGRYSWDKVKACGGVIAPDRYGTFAECEQQAARGLADGVGVIENKGEEPSWTIGLDYQATEDLFLYATSRRGYRGANVNTPAFETQFTTGGTGCALGTTVVTCPDLTPFQKLGEEKITDVEIGAKWDWRAGDVRGRFNLSAFRGKYKSALQFFNVVGTGVPNAAPDFPTRQSIGVNAADLTIQGLELEAIVTPFTGFTLSLNGAYTDTNVDSVDVPPIGGLSLREADITRYAPKFASTLGANWVLPVRPFDSDMVINADWFHTSRFGVQYGRSLPGYDVVNARVALNDIGGSSVSLAFAVQNLFNEKYFTAASNLLPTFPANSVYTGDQRMWSLEAKVRF